MDAKTKKMVNDLIEAKLNDFFLKNLQFRARKLGDTPQDVKQLSNQAGVTKIVNNATQNYLPLAGGNMIDGANIGTGSTTGTIIAAATSQKIGFHGKAATIQQTNTAGNTTAGATYGTNEQKMLNDAYSALRNKGLLS